MGPSRPFLVGLVCWKLIIFGTYIIYSSMKELGNHAFIQSFQLYPYPAWLVEVILFGTAAISVICGIFMYEGQGWARYPYLLAILPNLGQSMLSLTILEHSLNLQIPAQAHKLWVAQHLWDLDVLFCLFSAVVLFLPRARRYFNPPMYIDE
jgi:hypothetical protein